jgi:hypothetical protein
MRIVLHLLCIVAVLPYLVLASGFLVLGHIVASGSLFGMFETLVAHAAWFVSWRAIVIAALIILVAALGFNPRTRWAAAAFVCLVATASLIVIVTLNSSRLEFGQWVFLVPCIGALVGAGWLAQSEWRYAGPMANAA